VTDLEGPLATAIECARAAGAILLADFHRPFGPRGAGDKADADVEAEREIRRRLRHAYPDWSYRGEETGVELERPNAPVWVVDPNDGTRDYLQGRRGSAVSIALVAEGRPVLGVVFAFGYPDGEGDLFSWAEGCGPPRRNGEPVETSPPDRLDADHTVLVSSSADRDPETNLRCVAPGRFRTMPSVAHRLALVAVGEAAATSSLYAPCAWDYAGGHALLRGAGGELVDENGAPIAYTETAESQVQAAFGGSPAVVGELCRRPWSQMLTGASRGEMSPEPGHCIADTALLSRAHGCLLGQLAGDALGSLVEFLEGPAVAKAYPDGPRLLADGGTWETLAGQPTDDSEMAIALARSILGRGGYESPAAFEAYRAWRDSGPFDIGQATQAGLMGLPLADSEANGSVMRVSPLAIFAHAQPAFEVAELARGDSRLTHPHAHPTDGAGALAVAIAHAVAHGDGPRAAYDAARRWAEREASSAVRDCLDAAASAAPACDGADSGRVTVTLQNAFYELLHAPSLEAGVVATVRRGGDTDTNGAVAGALLGACHGRRSVPDQWRLAILSCRPHPFRGRRPRPRIYWPVDVLEIAERLLVTGANQRSGG
jgi:ADP-ribosyl-[dinitrogen reductase] hydrolase